MTLLSPLLSPLSSPSLHILNYPQKTIIEFEKKGPVCTHCRLYAKLTEYERELYCYRKRVGIMNMVHHPFSSLLLSLLLSLLSLFSLLSSLFSVLSLLFSLLSHLPSILSMSTCNLQYLEWRHVFSSLFLLSLLSLLPLLLFFFR